MKKSCELCSREARMYCESDQASLCWECDETVHAANFLVSKHSRNLLCHVCQSITQWTASGGQFGPTFSVCRSCFECNGDDQGLTGRRNVENQEIGTDQVGGSDDEEYSDSEEDDEEEEDEEEEEEDGENQVVPWTTPSSSPPTATTSSSEIGSFSTRNAAVSSDFRPFRPNTFLDSEDEDDGCCSSQVRIEGNGVAGPWRMPEELSQQRQMGRERGDSDRKRIRRMEVAGQLIHEIPGISKLS